MTLEPLELAVLQKLLDGDYPVLVDLRKQLIDVSVKSRELTGAGFFIELLLTSNATPVRFLSEKIQIGDVIAEIEGLKYGAGFLLYIEHGLITMLEGYSFEEAWPVKIKRFSLSYSDPSRRQTLECLSNAFPGKFS